LLLGLEAVEAGSDAALHPDLFVQMRTNNVSLAPTHSVPIFQHTILFSPIIAVISWALLQFRLHLYLSKP
jgi:hypothetical protein